MSDEVKVVCRPVKNLPDPVGGSIQLVCDECSQPVWISPVTLRILAKEQDGVPICTECWAKNHQDGVISSPTPGQVREVKDHFRGT